MVNLLGKSCLTEELDEVVPSSISSPIEHHSTIVPSVHDPSTPIRLLIVLTR